MFLEQQISTLECFLKDYVTLKLLFVNSNRFIKNYNDECCVPKCKLKHLKESESKVNSCNSRHVARQTSETTAYYIITTQPLGVL